MQKNSKKRLGELLVTSGVITEEQLLQALEIQRKKGCKLGEVFVNEGFVTEEQIMKVLESQLGIKSLDLSKFYVDPEAVKLIPENLSRKHSVIGVEFSNGQLLLAMRDPLDYFALEDIRLIVQMPIKQAISSEKAINDAIERFYSKTVAEKAVQDFFKQYREQNPKQTHQEEEVNEDVNNAPIVRFLNSVIENAVRNNSSDIHIEPEESGVRIRIRVDGVLQVSMVTGLETMNAIVSRIKIMSGLNIAERRIPQDGRITYTFDNRRVDLRVSTLPTTYGEKIVMRVLDKTNFLLSKDKLGFSKADMEKFDTMIGRPHGIILVTGPTGSGKSSTLYAMLNELNEDSKNIITLEDPVEYDLKGINQVQLNSKSGLTFAVGLRAILRQDPDVIMVGEIRDKETAEIAIRSALTGHLVLSTLHTNDAPGAVSRIMDMGIDPFLISSSVVGVIAQRLVRKICSFCREGYRPDDRESKILRLSPEDDITVYRGKGCPMCNGSGYKGRTAIFEIMVSSKNIRMLIDKAATSDEIRDEAILNNMVTLYDSCIQLVLKGQTTVDEVSRVAFSC